MLAGSPFLWDWRYISGHQDRLGSSKDRWATLNVEMDAKARAFMPTALRTPHQYAIPGEPWSIWYSGEKLQHNFTRMLYDLIHAHQTQQYWCHKLGMTNKIYQIIDWDALNNAIQAVPRNRSVFISKHTTGMCDVEKFMKRWRKWDTSACLRCGEQEDSIHVWRCKGQDTPRQWEKSIQDLSQWKTSVNTDPDVNHHILHHLWHGYNDSPLPEFTPVDLEAAINGQNSIGWGQFFEWWLHTSWAQTQQHYYSLIHSKCTGKHWVTLLIQKLWDIAWDLWTNWNDVLHVQENEVTRLQEWRADRSIRQLYGNLKFHNILRCDQYLLSSSLSTLLAEPLTFKTAWIQQATAAAHQLNQTL